MPSRQRFARGGEAPLRDDRHRGGGCVRHADGTRCKRAGRDVTLPAHLGDDVERARAARGRRRRRARVARRRASSIRLNRKHRFERSPHARRRFRRCELEANPFGYRSSSPSALAASKLSTRARRTDVFGPAERLPDARRRATRARRARRPRAARAHRPSSPRCAVESSRLPRPPRAAFFFPRAGVSVPSSARAVLSRAVCCCRHDG